METFEGNFYPEVPDAIDEQMDADYCADMIKHVHDGAEVTRREQLCLKTLVKCREYIKYISDRTLYTTNDLADYNLLKEVEEAIKELKGGK